MGRGLAIAAAALLGVVGCGAASRPTTTPAPVTASPSPSPSARPSGPTPSATAARTVAPAVPLADGSLAGRVIVLDPGHNGDNYAHPDQINRQVYIVNGYKACDTTGTATDAGYAESAFNLDVAERAAAILRAQGARVILTRDSNDGVGPCINERAAIANQAHADAAISIHADGGPADGLGFQVILPGDVGPNAAIISPSRRLGADVHDAFRAAAGEPFASYLGGGTGYTTETDLGGLNLSTVPKVFIECANMRNSADAARLTDPAWRESAARGIAAGLTAFLTGR
ncbi:MAG TPA: N-acetylmuramoyl-L-alanine amidase [Mycobacteriales bacterium]|nr:N-acetylmuramoyl-L-alanine amidase [Mycobacteriales bacterium]